MASPCAGAPALKYGDVNTETPSPSEVKGLIEQKKGFSNKITLAYKIIYKNKINLKILKKIYIKNFILLEKIKSSQKIFFILWGALISLVIFLLII